MTASGVIRWESSRAVVVAELGVIRISYALVIVEELFHAGYGCCKGKNIFCFNSTVCDTVRFAIEIEAENFRLKSHLVTKMNDQCSVFAQYVSARRIKRFPDRTGDTTFSSISTECILGG